MKSKAVRILSFFFMVTFVLAMASCKATTSAIPTATTSSTAPTSTTAATSTINTTATGSPGAYTVKVNGNLYFGNYLVDGNGMTLYWVTPDAIGTPNINGTTLANWPVFYGPVVSAPLALNASDFGSITRTDNGARQTTYKGWPLYYYIGDKAVGDRNGQGVAGVWSVVDPAKSAPAAMTTGATTTASPVSPAQTVVKPTGLHFFTKPGKNPVGQTIDLYTIGGPLNWTATINANWLSVLPSSGTATSMPTTLALQADASSMPAGDYNATLTIKSAGNDYPCQVPIYLSITRAEPCQVIDASIALSDNAGVLSLEQASLVTGLLEQSYSTGLSYSEEQTHRSFNAGDLGLILNATIRNNSDTDWQVSLRVEAYDEDGQLVAWLLDSGPLVGMLAKDITAKSSKDITFHLGWAEGVKRVKIITGMYPVWPPLP